MYNLRVYFTVCPHLFMDKAKQQRTKPPQLRHLLIIHNPFFRLPCLLTMPISLSLFINFSTPRRLIPIRSAASVAVNEGLEFSNKRSRLSFLPNFIPYFIPNSSPNFKPNSLSILWNRLLSWTVLLLDVPLASCIFRQA